MSPDGGLGRPEDPDDWIESVPVTEDRPTPPPFPPPERYLVPTWDEWDAHVRAFTDPRDQSGWRRQIRRIGVWAIIASIAAVVLVGIVSAL